MQLAKSIDKVNTPYTYLIKGFTYLIREVKYLF